MSLKEKLLCPSISSFSREINKKRLPQYEERELEFLQAFGTKLEDYIHPVAGFNFAQFIDDFCKDRPSIDGICVSDWVKVKYSPRASELMNELISIRG